MHSCAIPLEEPGDLGIPLRQHHHRTILYVAHIRPDLVREPVVCPEGHPALLADPDPVLTDHSYRARPAACRDTPITDLHLAGQTVHGPLFPIHTREVPYKSALAQIHVLKVLLGDGIWDEAIEYKGIPIYVLGILLVEREPHVCHKVCCGVSYAPDPFAGMHLLDDPSRILPEEPPGVDTSIAEDVEMRGEHPTILVLPPGMDYCDPSESSIALHQILDIGGQLVVVLLGLEHGPGELLGR